MSVLLLRLYIIGVIISHILKKHERYIMKVIKSNHYGGNATNIVMKDEDNKIVVVFEDKSTVLGNKITVYDNDGNVIYFLDEDISQSYDSFRIMKDANVIFNVKRDDNFVQKVIKIENRGSEYTFSALNKILQMDGNKLAKLHINKDSSFYIELHDEQNIEMHVTLVYAIFILIAT